MHVLSSYTVMYLQDKKLPAGHLYLLTVTVTNFLGVTSDTVEWEIDVKTDNDPFSVSLQGDDLIDPVDLLILTTEIKLTECATSAGIRFTNILVSTLSMYSIVLRAVILVYYVNTGILCSNWYTTVILVYYVNTGIVCY